MSQLASIITAAPPSVGTIDGLLDKSQERYKVPNGVSSDEGPFRLAVRKCDRAANDMLSNIFGLVVLFRQSGHLTPVCLAARFYQAPVNTVLAQGFLPQREFSGVACRHCWLDFRARAKAFKIWSDLERSGAGRGAIKISRPTPYAATQIRLSGARNLEHTKCGQNVCAALDPPPCPRAFNEAASLTPAPFRPQKSVAFVARSVARFFVAQRLIHNANTVICRRNLSHMEMWL